MSRQESTQRNAPPGAAPQTPGCPHLGAGLSRCSEGTSLVPAGARARSLLRPFGLNFVFAPCSACFKGQEKQTPPFIAEGRGGPGRGGSTVGVKKPKLRLRDSLGLSRGAKTTSPPPIHWGGPGRGGSRFMPPAVGGSLDRRRPTGKSEARATQGSCRGEQTTT